MAAVVNADKPSVTLTFAGLPPNSETAVAFVQWTMVDDIEKEGACDEGRSNRRPLFFLPLRDDDDDDAK